MSDDSPQHRDRYSVAGNIEAEFVDEAETVLVNRVGITSLDELQLREEELLAQAYESLLGEIRLGTPLTNDLIRYTHERIFGSLFAWAGRWRTVNISKPGVTWPPHGYVTELMDTYERDTLRRFPAASLTADNAFCQALAIIQGEFLVIHPFREGNARAIKLVTDMLAAQTERPLLAYDQSDAGRAAYIAGASQAFGRNYQPLEAIIRHALATARQGPATAP